MLDTIQYRTDTGVVNKTIALKTVTELTVPYDATYVDLTLILDQPFTDQSSTITRVWSVYEATSSGSYAQILANDPFFNGYFVSKDYGFRLNVTTTTKYFLFKTNTAARPDLAKSGAFISTDDTWFVTITRAESPTVGTDIDDPISFPDGTTAPSAGDTAVELDTISANKVYTGYLYADSAYIRKLKADSAFIGILNTNTFDADNALIDNAIISGGSATNMSNVTSSAIAGDSVRASTLIAPNITSSMLLLDSYVLDNNSLAHHRLVDSAFIKWNNEIKEWEIEPTIKDYVKDSDLYNYLPKTPSSAFLSYTDSDGYFLDDILKVGRFVASEEDFNAEAAVPPPGYITYQSVSSQATHFNKFVGFSNGIVNGVDTNKFNEEDITRWVYSNTHETIIRDNIPLSFSGIVSADGVTQYKISSSLTSQTENSEDIAIIIGAVKGYLSDGTPYLNTLSAVRKPRRYLNYDPNFGEYTRLPSFAIVYNYGLSDETIVYGDWNSVFSPGLASVTPEDDNQDDWFNTGSSFVSVEKTCVFNTGYDALSTTFSFQISDFGAPNSLSNYELTIDENSAEYLKQFIGRVSYGFGGKGQSQVYFNDLTVIENDPWTNEIIDLYQNAIFRYYTLEDIRGEFRGLITEVGYSLIPYNSLKYLDLYKSKRILYNKTLKKIFYIRDDLTVSSPIVLELGDNSNGEKKFDIRSGPLGYLKIGTAEHYTNLSYIQNASNGLLLTVIDLNNFNIIFTTAYDTSTSAIDADNLAIAIDNTGDGQICILSSLNSFEASITNNLRNIARSVGLIKLANLDTTITGRYYSAIFQKNSDSNGVKSYESLHSDFSEIKGIFANNTFFVYGPHNNSGIVSSNNQYLAFADSEDTITIDTNLNVTGNESINGGLWVDGDGTLHANLTVADSARIGTNLSVGQNGIIGNDLIVDHDAYVENTLHLQPWTDVGTFKGISWPADAFGGGGDNAAIYLVNGPADGENYELTIAVTNDKDSVGNELITDIINLSVPGDSATTNAKVNRQTIWHEGNYYLHIGNYITKDSDLAQSTITATSPEEIFNTWYRFSHYLSAGFPAYPAELNAWVYDSANNSILCTANSNSYIGFVSPETKDNFTLEATINSTDGDDDFIGLVIGFFIDSSGNEHTLSIGRVQDGGYPEPTQGWGLVYNLEQTNEAVLYEQTTTQTPGWNTSGGVRIGFTKNGSNLTIFSSQNGSTTYDPTLEYTINLDTAGYSMFSGANQYGFACCSQLNSTWTDIALSSTLSNGEGIIYNLGAGVIYERSFFGDLTEIGTINKPYDFNNRFFYNPNIKKLIYQDPTRGAISVDIEKLTPGPYTDDADAANNGVLVGAQYYKSTGQVFVRLT